MQIWTLKLQHLQQHRAALSCVHSLIERRVDAGRTQDCVRVEPGPFCLTAHRRHCNKAAAIHCISLLLRLNHPNCNCRVPSSSFLCCTLYGVIVLQRPASPSLLPGPRSFYMQLSYHRTSFEDWSSVLLTPNLQTDKHGFQLYKNGGWGKEGEGTGGALFISDNAAGKRSQHVRGKGKGKGTRDRRRAEVTRVTPCPVGSFHTHHSSFIKGPRLTVQRFLHQRRAT